MTVIDALLRGTSSSRNKLFWTLQGIGWIGVLCVAVAFAGRTYMEWHLAISISTARGIVGIALTFLMRLIYRRLRAKGYSVVVLTCWALVLSLLASRADIAVTRQIGVLTGLDLQSELLSAYMRNSLASRWILYTFWSVMYFGINYWLDTQQIELALARAEASAHASELKALKAQINPHFLFNALGSILAESGDNKKIRDLTLALSDYLRFLLQQRKDKAPLGEELEALENYLCVEKARFEERLMYQVEAEEDAREVLVPTSLVQPLLENAIKYGQRTCLGVLCLRISAHTESGFVVLQVSNSGSWVPPETNSSTKTGLANLRRRLELVYRDRATLDIATRDGTVTIEVRMPAKPAETVS